MEEKRGIFHDGHTTSWYFEIYNNQISYEAYRTFDEALIAALAKKYDNEHVTEYIIKMLDIPTEN